MRDSEVCMNNNVCACECPQPPTITIKDKVDDLNMTLADGLTIVNKFIKFVWGEDLVVPECLEVKSFDTAVEAALIRAKTLYDWLISVTARMGAWEEIRKSAEALRGTGENNESGERRVENERQ